MERVTLNSVAGGKLPALFERELELVLENIGDSRTPAKKARKITLEIIFIPDERRHNIHISANASSTLVKAMGFEGHMLAALDSDGKVIGSLSDPEQLELLDNLKTKLGGKHG